MCYRMSERGASAHYYGKPVSRKVEHWAPSALWHILYITVQISSLAIQASLVFVSEVRWRLRSEARTGIWWTAVGLVRAEDNARSSPHPSALFRPCLRPSDRVPARFVSSKPSPAVPAASGGGFDVNTTLKIPKQFHKIFFFRLLNFSN